MNSKRQERISQAYQRELSEILHIHVRDPKLSGVYVTRVVFTPDLRLAKIYFAISDDKMREREVTQALVKSKGFLKRELASRVEVKYVPDLKFYYDESSEVKEKIDELFGKIKEVDEAGEENNPA